MRAVLPAITAIAYLMLAVTPCPTSPPTRADASPMHGALAAAGSHSHGEPAADGDATSLAAPCLCGCEHAEGSPGVGKRVEPGLLAEPPPSLERGRSPLIEIAERLPDAPISVDSPVPIAT